jgi:hypothetical protein
VVSRMEAQARLARVWMKIWLLPKWYLVIVQHYIDCCLWGTFHCLGCLIRYNISNESKHTGVSGEKLCPWNSHLLAYFKDVWMQLWHCFFFTETKLKSSLRYWMWLCDLSTVSQTGTTLLLREGESV